MYTDKILNKKIEIIPAILVKTRKILLEYIKKVERYVKRIHIDIMDNKFVPNLTLGTKELNELPQNVAYEFHWMVYTPEKWIIKTKQKYPKAKQKYFHIVHIEAIDKNWEQIKKAVKNVHGNIGLAINPETPIKKVFPYIRDVKKVLIMSVHPGFSGQKYIKKVEKKILILRKKFPRLDIEVDGGINSKTVISAIKSGANKIAVASAVFDTKNAKRAIEKLRKIIVQHTD